METKICTKCKKELSLDNFRWKNKAEGKKHSQCKECQKAQEKKHYKESISRQESVRNTALAQKIRNAALVNNIKQNSCCAKCGESRFYVLDFHHKDKEAKSGEMPKMIRSSSLETLQAEIDKCVLLCSNCHREFHYLEREKGYTIEQYLDR